MKNSKFLISTVTGQIPNIIENSKIESLKGDLTLYLDDFLYKDSLYDTEGCKISLKELCAIDENIKILLAFRNTPKVLSSKRGNYKLTKEKFLKVLNTMKPDYYVDFTTQKIINFRDKSEIDCKFVDPKTPEEFYNLTKNKNTFVGTNFVNELIKNKQMLKFEDNRLFVTEITDCKCCGDLKEGYLAYLLSINEINGFIYLTVHNYNVLYEVFNKSILS